jgi:Tfp pilus assembly protein PilX
MMKKGFALITVLVVLILLSIGIATILQSFGSHARMKSNNLQELKAQYLAEAGMQRALWICRNNAGNCSVANGTTITTEEMTPITITTIPATAGAASYEINVRVDYTDI